MQAFHRLFIGAMLDVTPCAAAPPRLTLSIAAIAAHIRSGISLQMGVEMCRANSEVALRVPADGAWMALGY